MAKRSSAKPKQPRSAIVNRRAKFDYTLEDTLMVGISLTGQEVRAAREGHVQLKGSFVSVRSNELWLNNASFSLKLNEKGNPNGRSVDTRARRLLAKRREIDALIAKKQQGMSIVPTKLLASGRFIKIVIALGKGKKTYDKRETIKQRDQDRETKRAMKRY